MEWRNSRGTFNDIVHPIGALRNDSEEEEKRLLGKWFQDVTFSDGINEIIEYFLIVKVEINTESLDPIEFSSSSKISAKNRKKRDNLNYCFRSCLIVWCISQATLYDIGASIPYQLNLIDLEACFPQEPASISSESLVDECDIPFYIAPRKVPQVLSKAKFKRETKSDSATGQYVASIKKIRKAEMRLHDS